MKLNDLKEQLEQSVKAVHTCIGERCFDESATYTAIMSYTWVLMAQKKQEAYAISLACQDKGESAAKAETKMKASPEYRAYLILEGYHEALMEQIRNLRAKGKADKSEEMLS